MLTSLEKIDLENYLTDNFIETGTYKGDGIAYALQFGFKNLYSIELHYALFKESKERFKYYNQVHLYNGDSSLILSRILSKLTSPATFWLDGHYSGTHTALGYKKSPVIEELEQVKLHGIKEHIIMIDDLRYCDEGYYEFSRNQLIDKLLEINQKYKFTYLNSVAPNDILIAHF